MRSLSAAQSRIWGGGQEGSLQLSVGGAERAAMVADCIVIAASIVIGQTLYGFVVKTPGVDALVAVGVGLVACATHVFFAGRWSMYRLSAMIAPVSHLRRLAIISALVSLTLILLLFLLKSGEHFSRVAFLIFSGVEFVGLVASRLVLGVFYRRLLSRRAIRGRPVVVIADQGEVRRFSERSLLFHFGQEEVGRVVLGPEDRDGDHIAQAIELARLRGAGAFNLMVNWADTSRLHSLRHALRTSPLAAFLLPDGKICSVLERDDYLSGVRRMRILLQRAPLDTGALAAKRAFDFSVALIALIALSPLLAAVCLAIKLDSPGPVIFRQHRKGFNQKPFTIYKFRSMVVLENGPTVRQANRYDDRVTRVGRLLRRLSIDELPQLINVLDGSMSLVGPRPHAIAHDDHYGRKIDNYRLRHHVKPGITGWAQVNGIRGEISQLKDMQSRVDHDVWYVNNWSPFLDVTILVRTCLTVLAHDAY